MACPTENLKYRICESARSIRETLEHIVNMVEYAFTGKTFTIPEPAVDLAFPELRRATLQRIQAISEQLKAFDAKDFEARMAHFLVEGQEHAFPFWNTINGTNVGCAKHVGQLVSFRRAAGNPIDPGVHVYIGTRLDPESS